MKEKDPISLHKIRYKDCDPLGHLFNTRYIEYMLEAREDHIFEQYQLDLAKYMGERGMAWVIVEHQILYLKEAVRSELVNIKSSLIYYDPKIILNEYQMWNETQDQLKAILWTKFLHIDVNAKRTVSHPDDIQKNLEDMLNPVVEKSIQERVKYLLSNLVKAN